MANWKTKILEQMLADYCNYFGIRRTVHRDIIMKANEMHCFSYLLVKVLYMFRTGPLSIIRSITTLYTRNKYLSC